MVDSWLGGWVVDSWLDGLIVRVVEGGCLE